jgi:hypothetical protein
MRGRSIYDTTINRLQRLAAFSALRGYGFYVCVITILDLKPRNSVPPLLEGEAVPNGTAVGTYYSIRTKFSMPVDATAVCR